MTCGGSGTQGFLVYAQNYFSLLLKNALLEDTNMSAKATSTEKDEEMSAWEELSSVEAGVPGRPLRGEDMLPRARVLRRRRRMVTVVGFRG